MEKQYAKQIIEWAEEAKQYLTIRKEIILDDNTNDEQLGSIVRMMYRAKERAENESIERCKKFL
jgi:nicotinate-nucleotide pyrophosphorylase